MRVRKGCWYHEVHGFRYSLLRIVLFGIKGVDIQREVVLGAQPPRADFIVVKDLDGLDLRLRIFRHFRKINIIEFKNPNDELSEFVLWKAIGYAGFYINKNRISSDDVTLTLVRGAKPVKMFKEMSLYVKADAMKGIYFIRGWKVAFPIQVIVTTELEGREYAGFRAVSERPKLEDLQQIVQSVPKSTDNKLIQFYRDYLDIFSKLDSELVEEAKRRYSTMAKTWRDIFGVDEEVDAVRADERMQTTRKIFFKSVQDGQMQLSYAANETGMTVDQFLKEMTESGYKVPQTV